MKPIVFIPILNERENIVPLIRNIREAFNGEDFEFWFYDNGSDDGSYELLKRLSLSDEKIVVRRELKKGKNNVFRAFIRDIASLRDSVFLMVDGDNTYSPDIMPQMAGMVESGLADTVIANRKDYHTTTARKANSLGNKLICTLFRRMYGVDYDVFSGLRAFSYDFLQDFVPGDKIFTLETELAFHSLMRQSKNAIVDCGYQERFYGKSKIRILRDGMQILTCFFRMSIRYCCSGIKKKNADKRRTASG